MGSSDEPWVDDDAGQLVRPYTLTGGRTVPSTRLDLVSMVLATGRVPEAQLAPEHAEALKLCRSPTSVAEIAAHLQQPLMVTKVLLSDLIEWQAVTTRSPAAGPEYADRERLEALLDGLRRL
jgi:hypothetical protein